MVTIPLTRSSSDCTRNLSCILLMKMISGAISKSQRNCPDGGLEESDSSHMCFNLVGFEVLPGLKLIMFLH